MKWKRLNGTGTDLEDQRIDDEDGDAGSDALLGDERPAQRRADTPAAPLTALEIDVTVFAPARSHGRAYDAEDVEAFRERAAATVSELQRRLAAAEAQLAQSQHAPAADPTDSRVELLTRAQLAADKVIEQADEQARAVLDLAHRQQHHIVERARSDAHQQAAAEAERVQQAAVQAAAFAQQANRTARVQLQAVLTALSVELSRLETDADYVAPQGER